MKRREIICLGWLFFFFFFVFYFYFFASCLFSAISNVIMRLKFDICFIQVIPYKTWDMWIQSLRNTANCMAMQCNAMHCNCELQCVYFHEYITEWILLSKWLSPTMCKTLKNTIVCAHMHQAHREPFAITIRLTQITAIFISTFSASQELPLITFMPGVFWMKVYFNGISSRILLSQSCHRFVSTR